MNMKEMLAPVIAKGARSGARRASFKGVTIHNTGNGKQGAGALIFNFPTFAQSVARRRCA